MKKWYLSKTIWLAILQGIAGVLAAYGSENPDIYSIGYILIAKSILDIGLRFLTEKPI